MNMHDSICFAHMKKDARSVKYSYYCLITRNSNYCKLRSEAFTLAGNSSMTSEVIFIK